MTTLEIILVMTICIETGIGLLVICYLCARVMAFKRLTQAYTKFVDATIDDLSDFAKRTKEVHSRSGEP